MSSPRPLVRAALLVLAPLVLGALGCGGDDDGFDHYFTVRPYPTDLCNVADDRLAFRREMRLYSQGNTDVPPYSRALARYYRRHGLTFFSTAEVKTVEMKYALDTDSSALAAALMRDFPGIDLSDETALMSDPALYARIVKATVNFMFRPIVEFARSHGDLGTEITNLVVLPQILRPEGGGGGSGVVGLAISPALLAVVAGQDVAEAAA
jgi:hypothetical protein